MVRAKATEENNGEKSQNGRVSGGIGSFISSLFTDVQGQMVSILYFFHENIRFHFDMHAKIFIIFFRYNNVCDNPRG